MLLLVSSQQVNGLLRPLGVLWSCWHGGIAPWEHPGGQQSQPLSGTMQGGIPAAGTLPGREEKGGMLFAGRVGWQCPEHSSNCPCPVGSGAPCKAWCWLGTQRQLNPHPAHDAMAELGGVSTAGMTSPGPSPPSLWGHPGLNEGGVMEVAFPCPRGCNTLPGSEAGTVGCAWCCS